jgi:glutamine amidotransferase
MCRVLMYKGTPVLADHLLYQPDNSLIKQTHSSQMLDMFNLAGFGMTAWDRSSHVPEEPFRYHSPHIPIFDRNLKALAGKLRVSTMIAHVRGVPYNEKVTVGEQNAHPFQFPGARLALAHNGDLADFARMRFSLLKHVNPAIASHIRGNTDSEWIYAVFLSRFADPYASQESARIVAAVTETIAIIREVRRELGIGLCSPTNLFISDGERLVAVRYTFDFGCYDPTDAETARASTHKFLSLWYTTGHDYGFHDEEWKMIGGAHRADSVLLASEPLTRDTSTWLEVPEYSACYAETDNGRLHLRIKYLNV